MEFSSFHNYEELQVILGAKIKESRLSAGRYTQMEQAKAAGVPYSTYKLIEQQGKGSIEDMIKVFISMGKVEALNAIFPKNDESVIENYKRAMSNEVKRQRIRKKA